jgi:hypothetical protein
MLPKFSKSSCSGVSNTHPSTPGLFLIYCIISISGNLSGGLDQSNDLQIVDHNVEISQCSIPASAPAPGCQMECKPFANSKLLQSPATVHKMISLTVLI